MCVGFVRLLGQKLQSCTTIEKGGSEVWERLLSGSSKPETVRLKIVGG